MEDDVVGRMSAARGSGRMSGWRGGREVVVVVGAPRRGYSSWEESAGQLLPVIRLPADDD